MNASCSSLLMWRRANAAFVTLSGLATRVIAVIALCATMAVILPAQKLTTYSFDDAGGVSPAPLIQATNGNLWGTTSTMVYEITPGLVLTTVTNTLGGASYGALAQAANGDFYGTTLAGGGSFFKMTPAGDVTILYTFCTQGGSTCPYDPIGALVQGANGDFYGTTYFGGEYGYGTVFRIAPSGGPPVTLYSFCSQSECTDGSSPSAGLIQVANGDFYGTTELGGANRDGTVFKITPSGMLTTLHSFDGSDGAYPMAVLIQAANGEFYGTTSGGGPGSCGVVFKMTPSGALTVLASFDGTDGCSPLGVLQGGDGNFYGTTATGGTKGSGTIFKITPVGALSTVYNFCSETDCADGSYPAAGLVQDTNGDFYGTTSGGGEYYGGTVFRFSVGLPPFVETQTTFGAVGATVKILGTNLTGATSVSFNGTPATIGVVSSSEITTTVPTGATTGKVEVVTPHGTLSTLVPFTVLP